MWRVKIRSIKILKQTVSQGSLNNFSLEKVCAFFPGDPKASVTPTCWGPPLVELSEFEAKPLKLTIYRQVRNLAFSDQAGSLIKERSDCTKC